MKAGYVYIIAAPNDMYKVGNSSNPNVRLKALQTSSPVPLKPVVTFFVDDAFGAEKHVHKIWSNYRQNGEWFHVPKEVLKAFIEEAQNPEFWKNFQDNESKEEVFIELIEDLVYVVKELTDSVEYTLDQLTSFDSDEVLKLNDTHSAIITLQTKIKDKRTKLGIE